MTFLLAMVSALNIISAPNSHRIELGAFATQTGAKVKIVGAFRVVDGKVEAWNLVGSLAPDLQAEVSRRLARFEVTKITSDVMKNHLDGAVFAIAEITGPYMVGDIQPTQVLGYYVGAQHYAVGNRNRIYVGSKVKSGETSFNARFLLRKRSPEEKVLPFVAGSSFKLDGGTITITEASDGVPTGEVVLEKRDPKGYFVLEQTGLTDSKINLSLVKKVGKDGILADRFGSILHDGESGPPYRRLIDEGIDGAAYAIYVRPDQISGVRVTVTKVETVDRIGIPASPKS